MSFIILNYPEHAFNVVCPMFFLCSIAFWVSEIEVYDWTVYTLDLSVNYKKFIVALFKNN